MTAGSALEGWPPDDGDLLSGWLAGLRAVCAAESYPQDEDSVRLLALALLTVLNEGGASAAGSLWRAVFEALQVLCDRYDKWFSEAVGAADRYGDAYPRRRRGHVAAARIVAVRLVEALGDDTLPAWREAASARCVGPFARAVLAAWNRLALQYRMRDGRTVVDRFVASLPDLDAADREMLLGWRDPVEGIFEIRGQDRGAIILLNLIDDLEYRTYSNMGPATFRPLPRAGSCLLASCRSARCRAPG